MDIRWNAGIGIGQPGQVDTKTAADSIARGISQATPVGIVAAKDAFEKATNLGNLPGQVLYSRMASPAQHLSPAAYLQEFQNTGMLTESMKHLSSQSGSLADQKVFEGISQKLTREKLDIGASLPDPRFKNQDEGELIEPDPKKVEERLKRMYSLLVKIMQEWKDVQKNAASQMK